MNRIIKNNTTPPTDPAITGVSDPLPEALSNEVPVIKFTVSSQLRTCFWINKTIEIYKEYYPDMRLFMGSYIINSRDWDYIIYYFLSNQVT